LQDANQNLPIYYYKAKKIEKNKTQFLGASVGVANSNKIIYTPQRFQVAAKVYTNKNVYLGQIN